MPVLVVVPVGVPSTPAVVVVLVVVVPVEVEVVVVVVVEVEPSEFVVLLVVVDFAGLLSPQGTHIGCPLKVPGHCPVGHLFGWSFGSIDEAVCSPPVQLSPVEEPTPADTGTPFLMY